MANPCINLNRVLTSASNGLRTAEEVLRLLRENDQVIVNLRAVESMTPSFANAFLMTLLETLGSSIGSRVVLSNAPPRIADILTRSEKWYNSGIKLSTQRTATA